MLGIIARKVGMTQVYAADGKAIPVTVVKAGPCVVVQRKSKSKDGYDSVQLGLVEERRVKHVNKPSKGHFDKAGLPPCRVLRELRVAQGDAQKPGDRVSVEIFAPGDKVKVQGTSKGKGFQGVVKRHHFRGGAATHGSMFHRAPGSIGASSFPSRVFKGTRMGGRMGGDRVTVKNLEVVRVDAENNLLVVRGAVPGARGTLLYIRKAKSSRPARG
jgi:large subunit ribosomal protein L3